MSPFATFSTESFFNNFFISERISYSEEVTYTATGLNGHIYLLPISDIVISNNENYYLIHSAMTSYQKVVATNLAGSFLLIVVFNR